MARALPLPPVELAARVGGVKGIDPLAFYEREGAAVRARIESLLGDGWSFEGRRVLDFGCGSGRVLRQFADQTNVAEFWGCDVHGPSIDWCKANLSPPFRCFQNDFDPPLPLAEQSLDLIWATSVFTHITDNWSRWLLELHRTLVPGGTLIASFLGEGVWDAMVGEPYVEDQVGMTVLRHWQDGPWVFHSEWWLRAHWGRLFDVVHLGRPPRDGDGSPEVTHSYIVLRKRAEQPPTSAELERCAAEEPRELAGMRTNLRLVRAELETLLAQPPSASARSYGLGRAVLASPLGAPARRLRQRLRASE